MQDRVATYPNRWKLTPVAGQTNVYDFERADEPVVAGTPLDKATFLTDTTAAAIAALTGNTPTLPTEALDELAGIFAGMGVTDIAHVEFGSYVGAGQHGASHPNTLTFNYEPRMLFVAKSTTYLDSTSDTLHWIYGLAIGRSGVKYTVTDNTISWYTTSTGSSADAYQCNESGATYYYLAIGVN